MDAMKIQSKFTTGVISKLVELAIKKKVGYDLELNFNEIATTITDGKAHMHLDLDVEIEKDEIIKILQSTSL